MGVAPLEPARRRLADRPVPQGPGRPGVAALARLVPSATTCRTPANQAKLEAADALAELAEEAGLTLIEMALAFVLEHPGVTAPIIGPRTMEQLDRQLAAAEIRLDDDVLDRIDEIVPPGVDRQPGRRGWIPPAIDDPRLRRRSLQGL